LSLGTKGDISKVQYDDLEIFYHDLESKLKGKSKKKEGLTLNDD